MFHLFGVERVVGSTPSIALAIRVHEGTVRVGDHVTRATDPAGESRVVDLEVRFLSITDDVDVVSLDENYGGLATLFGQYPQRLGEGWELTG